MALDPVTAALDLGGKLLDKFFPDPQQRAEAELEFMKLKNSGQLAELANEAAIATGQMAVNTEEAKSQSLFIAGWRPFVGWNCGFGLSYQFLVYPILVSFNSGIVALDTNTLMTLLCGLLGLGSLRTVEKLKGKQ